MLEIALSAECIKMAEHNLKVDQERGKTCEHVKPMLQYVVDWTEYPQKWEDALKVGDEVYEVKEAYANGVGLFDVHFENKQGNKRVIIGSVNCREKAGHAIVLQLHNRNLLEFVGKLKSSQLTEQKGERAIDFVTSELEGEDLDTLIIDDQSIYALAHIKRTLKVKAFETPAVKVKDRYVLDMVYTAVNDANSPSSDDLVTVYNVADKHIVDTYADWTPAGCFEGMFEEVA